MSRFDPLAGSKEEEEIRHHLAECAEELIQEGWDPEAARMEAERRFGSVARVRRELTALALFSRLARGMGLVASDARHSLRSLWRAKGYSVTVIATLALCVGANATVLSALYHLVLRPRPVPEPERLVQLFNLRANRNPANPYSESSWVQYLDLRSRTDLFDGAALRAPASRVVRRGSSAARVTAQMVTADFYGLIGAAPVIGRFFSQDEVEDGPGDVVVLSQSWWEDEFDADPDVIGTRITFDNQLPYTIVGVAPRSVEAFDHEARFALPYVLASRFKNPARGRYNAHSDDLWLRLKPGVTREVALKRIRGIERDWADGVADEEGRRLFGFYDARVALDLPSPLERSLYLLEGGSLVIFLAGCLNVMILVLGRANRKRLELSVRQALGGGLPALRRLMLVESALLAGAAALAGMTMAWGGIRIVNRYLAVLSPRSVPVHLDVPVLGATLAVSVGLVLLMNLLPVEVLWRSGTLQRVNGTLRTSTATRYSMRVGGGLIVGQVAIALVLLVGAGLLVDSFRNVLAVDPGFDVARVVEGRLDFVTVQAFYPSRADAAVLKRRVVDAMSDIPGVESVGLSMFPMFSHDLRSGSAGADSTLDPSADRIYHYVSPAYFATMGIPIVEGRACSASDDVYSVVVDRLYAQRVFGEQSPIGLEIEVPGVQGLPRDRVVGMAGRANLRGLEQRDGAGVIYRCEPVDRGWWEYSILLRTRRPAPGVVRDMEAALRAIDLRVPLSYAGSLQDEVDEMLLGRRAITLLLSSCAGLALLLSLIGIYAVLAQRVGQRLREIGIRVALGADRLSVYRVVLADGLGTTLAGLALGTAGAVVMSRSLERLLFDVTATDPRAYVGALGLFLVVATAACLLPAARAAGVDPVESLRAE